LAVCPPSLAVTSDGRSRQYVTRNSDTAELYALGSSKACTQSEPVWLLQPRP
jgi:hypothetical protein